MRENSVVVVVVCVFVIVVVSTIVGIIVAANVVAVNPVVIIGKNGDIVLNSVNVVLVIAIACDKGAVLFDSVNPKKKKLNDSTSPPGLLSQVSMSLTTEKKLAFDLTSKNKLQHYDIDWLNPYSAKGKHLDKTQVASLYCNAYKTSQEEG